MSFYKEGGNQKSPCFLGEVGKGVGNTEVCTISKGEATGVVVEVSNEAINQMSFKVGSTGHYAVVLQLEESGSGNGRIDDKFCT